MLNDYEKLLESKRHKPNKIGIKSTWFPNKVKDFQRFIISEASERGRCAGFIDTGLGKTLMELTIAYNYAKSTNKRVLIITPLAVAFQFISEAEKFGIDDIAYSKDGKLTSKIVVCNYERLDKFNTSDFDTVILDESSILKNFEGEIKKNITIFMRKTKYRFLFTATPSPNDFVELGTSSEALGSMQYIDMLSAFFTNKENTLKAHDQIHHKWMLKPHATKSFFEWVSTWSISLRKPSDLGFSDEGYDLPELKTEMHKVKNRSMALVGGQYMLFNIQARRMGDVRTENKQTIKDRCEKAVELAQNHDTSVYWTNLNNESDLIEKLDKDSVQIKGSMNLDKKEEILLAFSKGEIKKLITKPKMTAFGLNWQHCNHTVYFPTFSYEQYYQSIRRFWRFGQTKPVLVDLVTSDGQERVINALMEKTEKANELFSNLNSSLHQDFTVKRKEFNKELILPKF